MTNREPEPRFDGLFNFRDCGGHPAAGGRRVKRGRLFRSDDLSRLSPADKERLEGLGLVTVIDFRDGGEVKAWPDWRPSGVTRAIPLPIDAGSLMRIGDSPLTRSKAAGMMVSVYRSLVNDFTGVYRGFFQAAGDPGAAPLLFHCTAGKDRTGLAAALLLSALGVDRAAIMDDYLVSKANAAGQYRPGVDYDPAMEPFYTVEQEFLEAAFAVIDGEYGGVAPFLGNQLGADCGALRELYTEKHGADFGNETQPVPRSRCRRS